MKELREDEFLRPLFARIGLEKVPEGLDSRIMEQILAEPETVPVPNYGQYWLWAGIILAGGLSVYFTGALMMLAKIFLPYLVSAYNLVAGYVDRIIGLFPSNMIELPSSFILPVMAGMLFILLLDAVFGRSTVRLLQ